MNILFSVFANGWGGLERYPIFIHDTLTQNGHNVFVLTLKGSRLYNECIKSNINVFGIHRGTRLSFRTIRLMKQVIKDHTIDIVHSNTSREIYNWYIALLGTPHVKYFMTFHIGVPNHRELLHRMLYRRVQRIIAISESERTLMEQRLPVSHEKLTLLYNYVDLNRFNPQKYRQSKIRSELGIPKDAFLFTAVANISKGKGIWEFIQAARVLAQEKKQVFFLWVGHPPGAHDEYSMAHLKKEIARGGLEKQFILSSAREDIPQVLSESDVFVLPAHKESFGLVFLEAMAMGLPVVGCCSGGVPEFVTDGINGFLARPQDSRDLSSKMALFVGDHNRITSMGHINMAHVKAFSRDEHVKKLLSLYERSSEKT